MLWPTARTLRLTPNSVTVRIATIPALWLPCEHLVHWQPGSSHPPEISASWQCGFAVSVCPYVVVVLFDRILSQYFVRSTLVKLLRFESHWPCSNVASLPELLKRLHGFSHWEFVLRGGMLQDKAIIIEPQLVFQHPNLEAVSAVAEAILGIWQRRTKLWVFLNHAVNPQGWTPE